MRKWLALASIAFVLFCALQANAPQWHEVYSDERVVITARKGASGLNVMTPEGTTVSLDIQEKPAYFFSPG